MTHKWRKQIQKFLLSSTAVEQLQEQARGFTERETTVIFSSARSGSTLLMEQLAEKNISLTVFEPLNPDFNECAPLVRRVSPMFYESQRNQIDQLLLGQKTTLENLRYNQNKQYDRLLVKTVRSNFILPAFKKKFPEVEVVYLVRDCKAVVASRVSLGWPAHLEEVLADGSVQELYAEIDLASVLAKVADNIAGKQAVLWCLENSFLTTRHDVVDQTVLYESLRSGGKSASASTKRKALSAEELSMIEWVQEQFS